MPQHFPTINSANFTLREIVDQDINHIYKGLSHPDIIKYYGVSYDNLIATQEQMTWFKELRKNNTGIWWAIVDNNSETFYGAIGLNNLNSIHKKVEIGFWLLPAFWNKGIMKKAVELVCNYAFSELSIHRIEALVETKNSNSKNLLTKSGFKYEGTLVDYEIKNDNFISLDSYAKFY